MRGGDVVPRSPIAGVAGVPSRTRGILPAAARSSHRHHGHGRRDNRRASIFLDRRGSVCQCFGSGVAITPRGGMLKNRVRYNRSTEGRVMPSFLEISPDMLSRLIGTRGTPCIIDVRTDEDCSEAQSRAGGARSACRFARPLQDVFRRSEQLEAGMILHDALFRWCREATEENHNWPIPKKRA